MKRTPKLGSKKLCWRNKKLQSWHISEERRGRTLKKLKDSEWIRQEFCPVDTYPFYTRNMGSPWPTVEVRQRQWFGFYLVYGFVNKFNKTSLHGEVEIFGHLINKICAINMMHFACMSWNIICGMPVLYFIDLWICDLCICPMVFRWAWM